MSMSLVAAVLGMILSAEGPGSGRVPVVVAARPLPAGTVVTYELLAARAIPSQIVTKSVVTPGSASYVVGQRVTEDIDAGVALRWSVFATASSEEEVARCARAAPPDSPPLSIKGVAPREGEKVRVLVAARDIEADSTFDAAAFSSLEIPTEYAGWHAIRAADAEKLKGQRILVPMLAGDPLYATQLAVRSEPKRCRIIFEEMGNRFLLGAPPDEARVVVCPEGMTARSGIPAKSDETKGREIGWIRFCEKRSGVRHGPFAAWSRQGFLLLRGRLVRGHPEGRFDLLEADGSLSASIEYRDGARQGVFESGTGDAKVRGEYQADSRQGLWSIADGKGAKASGRFADGRFAGTWRFEKDGEPHALAFEDGRPKGAEVAKGISIAVLARDLKAGEVVREQDVSSLVLPPWAANAELVKHEDAHYLVGQKAPFPLAAGAPLLWVDFETLWRFDTKSLVLEKAEGSRKR